MKRRTDMSQSQAKTPKCPELGERIRVVRAKLRLTQQDFAGKLLGGKVSRVQISEWENGTETPSNERIIDISNLASDPADRLWFLTQAGVDLNAAKAALVLDATSA